ncbi:VanW family protein [Hymenobacter sp. BRD128]|uniref:VanW family protein n=1 Tax=Hymenobacter sp. BRD128 TaxID=2675878 RepID=UPI001564E671|nr:VanW family protein [Hymenobacter sp. BRD128]QKG56386.1 VanW family protein [Hymenobacter sp. BRD128]
MSTPTALAERHTWLRDAVFQLKAQLLTGRRQWQNLLAPPPRCRPDGRLAGAPVLASSASDLWNPDDTPTTWLLTAGKVENLRRATRRLHGLEVPAGAVFSFWRHVGQPSRRRGYVPGREIREGCVVPIVAGGLCQLSNALYDAALQAGFAIVERHRHTRVIAGSLAELDRDATVKWSYLDLRFRPPFTFRLEVELTADRLLVRFRAAGASPAGSTLPAQPRTASKLNDCYSCGNRTCFKHPGQVPARPAAGRTTFVLDEYWPEFARYVQATATPADVLLVPLPANGRGTGHAGWPRLGTAKMVALGLPARWRQVQLRLAARAGRNVFAQSLRADRQVALAAARRLAFDCTHLVVAQTLLPFLGETGALAGRTYDVLLTRLPAEVLHQRLDRAHAQHPASPTLRDFRAGPGFVEAESRALTQARRLFTPHHELVDLFHHKAERLEWALPPAPASPPPGQKILFPAAALARKGAYEMRRLAQELQVPLVVAGRATEHAGFWQEITTSPAGADPLAGVGLVVYPAYVEHQPRLLLRALAAGIPVVATAACGLSTSPGLTVVPAGDYAALRKAVLTALVPRN